MPENRLISQIAAIQTKNAGCANCELNTNKPVVIRAEFGDQSYLACVTVACSPKLKSNEVMLFFEDPQLAGRVNWIMKVSACGLFPMAEI
jgi:hypothetical protein